VKEVQCIFCKIYTKGHVKCFVAMDSLNENGLPRRACCFLDRLSVQYGEVAEWGPQEIRDSCGVSVGSRYKARRTNLCETWCDLLSLTSPCCGWRDVRICILVRMYKYELCIKLIYQSPILVLVFWSGSFLIEKISRRFDKNPRLFKKFPFVMEPGDSPLIT
jgi:hypothetical protein